MVDRLGRRPALGRSEDGLQGLAFERQEVVRAGKAHHTPDVARGVHAHLAQPTRVERQHGRVVGACGMAHQHKPAGVAAEILGVVAGPGHGPGVVFQKGGIAGLGIDPVVGDHRHHARLGQGGAHKAIEGLGPAFPIAAVDEHHDRGAGMRAGRRIDVQAASRSGLIGDVGRAVEADSRSHQGDQESHQCAHVRRRATAAARAGEVPGTASAPLPR